MGADIPLSYNQSPLPHHLRNSRQQSRIPFHAIAYYQDISACHQACPGALKGTDTTADDEEELHCLPYCADHGFDLIERATLESLILEVVDSSKIEGEFLNPELVRSSIARK